MDIFVNGSKMAYALENESILGEVIESLFNWIDEQRHQLYSISVDGTILDENNIEEWKNKPLTQIDRIEIATLSDLDARLVYLGTLNDFLALLKRALEEDSNESLSECRKLYPSTRKRLQEVLSARKLEGDLSLLDKLDSFLDDAGLFDEDKGDRQELQKLVNALSLMVTELTREASNPFEELLSTTTALRGIVSKLEDIPLQLQTGKDASAMEVVVLFAEISQKLLRLYPNLKAHKIVDFEGAKLGGKRFDEFYVAFNKNLSELAEAFQIRDFVLIGDLLEYEISPRVGELMEFLEGVVASRN